MTQGSERLADEVLASAAYIRDSGPASNTQGADL